MEYDWGLAELGFLIKRYSRIFYCIQPRPTRRSHRGYDGLYKNFFVTIFRLKINLNLDYQKFNLKAHFHHHCIDWIILYKIDTSWLLHISFRYPIPLIITKTEKPPISKTSFPTFLIPLTKELIYLFDTITLLSFYSIYVEVLRA